MLTGVTMELAGARGPAIVIPGVTLSVDAGGLTVTPPSGPAATVGWTAVGWARCGEGGVLADGAPAVAVVAAVAGRLVRWLVPEEQMPPGRAVAIDHLLTTRTVAVAPEGAPAAAAVPGHSLPGHSLPVEVSPRRGGVSRPPFGSSPVDRRRPRAPVARPPVVPLRPAPTAEPRGASRGRRRPLAVMVAWLAVLALVLVGAGLLVAVSIPVHHPRHGEGSGAQQALTEARTLSRTISLRLADLPAGWAAVSTSSGPLSGFVGARATVTSSPVASAQTASRYARCLGVRSAAVPFVSVGPSPLAQSSSGAFAGPSTGAPMQVASITAVYATPSPVRRAVAQLDRRGFASCFGAAVGGELARSVASRAPTGVTTGTASTQALPLPRWAGIRATGVELKLPLDVRGESTSVQLGFVFVTGARVETTLVSFSTTGVPENVTRALAATLEEEVAAARAA